MIIIGETGLDNFIRTDQAINMKKNIEVFKFY